MARSKYPGVGLAAVNKFCGACIRKNKDNRQEYAGLSEENGNYYLVDGFRMVRFHYDLPELIHAEKKEIGSQPSMLHFIENARQKCSTADKSAEIELPDLKEVKASVDMNKAAMKRKEAELPIPLAGGRIWVNPAYLLTMMQIFPMQRIVTMTGNPYQPIYFNCDGADGILMPMRCDNPVQTMERWEERKAHAQKEPVDGQTEKEKPMRRTVKHDNMGQPTNLSQLKKRLTVGAAFEIHTITGELQQRRVIKAHTNAIVSIVPFDAEHKVTADGGSWMWFDSASKWAFADGWCKYLGDLKDTDFAIFSIRLIETTQGEDARYNTWLANLEAQRAVEQERKEADRTAQKQAEKEKQAQEIEDALTAAETAIFERGKRVNNDTIHGKCLVLRLAERYNINVPMRTAGWISKNLGYFIVRAGNTHEAGIQVWSTKKTPQGVCDVLFDLLHAVDAHFAEETEDDSEDMMTDEEIERFFNGGIVFPHSDSADTQDADKTDSGGVSAAGNGNVPLAYISANTAVSDADKPIYSKYTQNLADGHNTAPPLNTS